MKSDELKTLYRRRTELAERIDKIEWAAAEAESAPNIGRFFKGTNNYSCPETDADYWPWYFKCTGNDGRYNTGFAFERAKDGHCSANHLNHIVIASHGLTEITAAEWDEAWSSFLARLTADEAGRP